MLCTDLIDKLQDSHFYVNGSILIQKGMRVIEKRNVVCLRMWDIYEQTDYITEATSLHAFDIKWAG